MDHSHHIPKIAVIGGGHLGRIHAKLAANSPDCQLLCVSDPFPPARSIIEEQMGLTTVSDYRDCLGKIDGAIVAAPTFLHHEIGTWCLQNGIHVFMEKPMATSLQEASELTQLSQANDLTLQVGHVERFNPVWQWTSNNLDGHPIHYIEATREGTYSGRSTDIGIVMDLMIHDIDLILSVMNSSIETVHAYGWKVLGEHEDLAVASLTFRNGARAQLRASRISPIAKRQMQIYSDDGQLDVDFAAGTVTTILPLDDVASGLRQADALPAELRAKVKDSLFEEWLCKTTVQPAAANAIQCEHDEFFAAIRYSKPVTVSGQHGHQALEVATWILESMEQRLDDRHVIPLNPAMRSRKAA